MTDKTLEALKGSIAKWKTIVKGIGIDQGPNNCPLCDLFYEDRCEGCPVSDKTGRDACSGTPYTPWANQAHYSNDGYEVRTDKHKALAQAELDFLKSLLPNK